MSYVTYVRTVEAWDREGGLGPPGAIWLEEEQAWNFALYSRHARSITLLLYGDSDFVQPVFELQLDPLQNKTARIWHCLVEQKSAPAARYYAYRVQGPWNPSVRCVSAGQEFSRTRLATVEWKISRRHPLFCPRRSWDGGRVASRGSAMQPRPGLRRTEIQYDSPSGSGNGSFSNLSN